ncbi:MAG TPA: hypothetical protein VFO05_06775 [Candidatus Limnocylindrales bacterium]|nr:hypothetical protein [Candidatus Limnocylindrales bacterium]
MATPMETLQEGRMRCVPNRIAAAEEPQRRLQPENGSDRGHALDRDLGRQPTLDAAVLHA